MKLAPMRYKGYTFDHNPKTLKIEGEKYYRELPALTGVRSVKELDRSAKTISGTGEFFGETCIEQFYEINRLFEEGGTGLLSIAGYGTLFVSFISLEFTQPPLNDYISYEFVFKESAYMQNKRVNKAYHVLKENETLWDIAYIYKVPVEKLLEKNQGVSRPENVKEGDKVCLP